MPVETGTFTFLQLSDVHLDSSFASSHLAMPAGKRRQRSKEMLDTFVRALELARCRQVDAVLIPGDLFDCQSIAGRTINRVIEAAGQLGDIPLLIAPGNHDYCSPASFYNQEVLCVKGMRQWPPNVHIFTKGEFQTWKHPGRSDVSFTGRAFTANVPVAERLLSCAVARDESADFNILLFHGSLDGYRGGDCGWPGKITAPFSAAELVALGFSYAAVGHYHDYTEIRSAGGALSGAYAGCLCGRGLDEAGRHYAIAGSITRNGHIDLEPIELDRRRIIKTSFDLTGCTSAQVLEGVRGVLAQAGAREELDMVYLRLDGRYPAGGQPDYVAEELAGSYFHFALEDLSRPDYLTEKFDRRTTEGRFIQALSEMKKEAAAAGGFLIDNSYDAELSTGTIEDALYYGLDALKQKKVTVRYVD